MAHFKNTLVCFLKLNNFSPYPYVQMAKKGSGRMTQTF